MNLLAQLRTIRIFAFDMDGVLTDGGLWLHPEGEWVRRMHIKDGYALQLAVRKGYWVCVISGSQSGPVASRLEKLGITDIFMGVSDKKECLEAFARNKGIDMSRVLYMGDDIPDMDVMKAAGISCCPSDAAIELREFATYLSPIRGGEGCVRDVIEKVLKLNGHWDASDGIRSI
jgi:3-deoxy-D-manno-octulosonate 8-phosphate phosphatase (KDO 8-P phosphatase)